MKTEFYALTESGRIACADGAEYTVRNGRVSVEPHHADEVAALGLVLIPPAAAPEQDPADEQAAPAKKIASKPTKKAA